MTDLTPASLWDDNDPMASIDAAYQLWWHWADFHIYIIDPYIERYDTPLIILPDEDKNEKEHVYNILDSNDKLSTSKAEDMLNAGMSMCKMHYTIEKMVALVIEKLKSSGIDTQKEVQVAFHGHELAKRKAFESVINLNYNLVITNFDPETWGQQYLDTVKRLADKGYGYPREAPRDIYRLDNKKSPAAKK